MPTETDASESTRPAGKAAKTGAARQQAYRQRKKLKFLEVTETTYGRLHDIRKHKGWTMDQAVAEALTLLEAELKAAARSAALVEMHRRTVREETTYGTSQPAKTLENSRAQKPAPEKIEGQGSLL